MRALLVWLRSHPVITVAAALGVLVYGADRFLDWQTEHRWQRYRVEATARGAVFSLRDLTPPDVPPEQNFATLPMWEPVLHGSAGSPANLFKLPRPPCKKKSNDPLKETEIDWSAWREAFEKGGLISDTSADAVGDVLRALDTFGPKIAQWRQWKSRPFTRFPFDPGEGVTYRMPESGELLMASEFFTLRMRAHLAKADSPTAFDDFADAMQSYRAFLTKPFFMASLMRMSIPRLVLDGVGDGLAKQNWREQELAGIEASLSQLSMYQDLHIGLSTERVFANSVYEELIRDPAKRSQLVGGRGSPNSWETVMSASISRRKLRKSQMRTNADYDGMLAGYERDRLAKAPPTPVDAQSQPSWIEQWQFYPYTVMQHLFPGWRSNIARAARLENLILQGRTAVALERYRLRHGAFPENLDSLVPDFLPSPLLDPWMNRPMIFSRTDRSFHLYSPGPDTVDHGGELDPKKSESEQRDEIWFYAPNCQIPKS